jgi:hypothetical protein
MSFKLQADSLLAPIRNARPRSNCGSDGIFSSDTARPVAESLRRYAQPYLQLPQGADPRFRFARAQLFLDVLGLAATTRLVCLLAGCRIRLGAITSQATVFSVATKRGHGRLRAFSLYSQR